MSSLYKEWRGLLVAQQFNFLVILGRQHCPPATWLTNEQQKWSCHLQSSNPSIVSATDRFSQPHVSIGQLQIIKLAVGSTKRSANRLPVPNGVLQHWPQRRCWCYISAKRPVIPSRCLNRQAFSGTTTHTVRYGSRLISGQHLYSAIIVTNTSNCETKLDLHERQR